MDNKKNKLRIFFKNIKTLTKRGVRTTKEKVEEEKKKVYLGYPARIAIFGLLFAVLFSVSYFFVMNSFTKTEGRINTYQEIGTLDYRVYLKENNFYDRPYLDKGMVYVANLIKNIDITFNYKFFIDKQINANFNYGVTAKLMISDDSGSNVYYQKDYTLIPTKKENIANKSIYNASQKVSISYDEYNKVANSFKSTYGVDATSTLVVYFNVSESIADEKISNSNQMSVSIPLSQKSININIDNSGINNTKNIIVNSETKLDRKIFIVFAIVLFIGAVASLLKFLELIFAMNRKPTVYDKFIKKIFADYDRLIVETKTSPNFDGLNIIKIEKFEELLDARDTLKQPIMYFEISAHNKCYFYIKNNTDVYLTTIKAVDLEGNDNEKKKKK